MPQHITVIDYNPKWKQFFKRERTLIKSILGDNAVEIYHIGSTAVSGLCAKPIIDIMPVVKDLAEVDSVASSFESIGYEYLGEFGIKGRRYLRKGGDERTHQVHIFQVNDTVNIERHIAVRDYLRTHASESRLYGELKKQLASQYPYDIDGYCEGKDQFVKELEIKSLLWYKNSL